jgi:hypothetical protein
MSKKEEIKKFNGSNWYEFESDMMYHLMAKKLWSVVAKKEQQAAPEWEETNMQAIGIIVSRVEAELRESIRGKESAHEIWETLKGMSESKSSLVTSRVRSEWESTNFQDEGNMMVYLGKLEKCRRLLVESNAEIGEGEICLKAIKLGSNWKSFTDALMADPRNIEDYETLKNRLITEYNRRVQTGETGTKESTRQAMNVQKARRNFEGKCHNCDKVGHKKNDCWAKGGGKEGQGPRRSSHANYGEKNISSYALNVSQTKSEKNLILDSGCTDHMVGTDEILSEVEEIKPIEVHLADNTTRKCTQRGTLTIQSNGVEISFKKTLIVPKLAKRLISVSKLIQKGCKIVFLEDKAQIFKDNIILFEASHKNGLYQIVSDAKVNLVISKSGKSLMEWHRILGHLNLEAVKRLPNTVSDMVISDYTEEECKVCCKAKATRLKEKWKG